MNNLNPSDQAIFQMVFTLPWVKMPDLCSPAAKYDEVAFLESNF
jgi:hypothetical protein